MGPVGSGAGDAEKSQGGEPVGSGFKRDGVGRSE